MKKISVDGKDFMVTESDDGSMKLTPYDGGKYTITLTEDQMNILSNVLWAHLDNYIVWTNMYSGDTIKFSDSALQKMEGIQDMLESVAAPGTLSDDFLVAKWE